MNYSQNISDLGEIEYESINLDQIKEKLQCAKSEKIQLQQQLEKLDKLQQQFHALQQEKHQQELKLEISFSKRQNQTLIQDFEISTGYSSIETFKNYYLSLQKRLMSIINMLMILIKICNHIKMR